MTPPRRPSRTFSSMRGTGTGGSWCSGARQTGSRRGPARTMTATSTSTGTGSGSTGRRGRATRSTATRSSPPPRGAETPTTAWAPPATSCRAGRGGRRTAAASPSCSTSARSRYRRCFLLGGRLRLRTSCCTCTRRRAGATSTRPSRSTLGRRWTCASRSSRTPRKATPTATAPTTPTPSTPSCARRSASASGRRSSAATPPLTSWRAWPPTGLKFIPCWGAARGPPTRSTSASGAWTTTCTGARCAGTPRTCQRRGRTGLGGTRQTRVRSGHRSRVS
mmetsp:Transcript_6392/g.15447  ORF Transcript_6392/g.15447 Transcript_6392/m.15447 type:complete len:278 (-) Transcript_6392:510-1343(-)